MDILDDTGVSKLSAKVFFLSELPLRMTSYTVREINFSIKR